MEIKMIKVFLLLILIIGTYIFIKKKEKYKQLLNEKFWIFLSWTSCLILYFFSGIKYTFNLDIYSFGYIILFWCIFFFGEYIGKIVKREKKNQNKKIDFKKKINFFPFFVISLICSFIYIIYMMKSNDIIIGTTRNINTNSISTALLMLSSVSLVIWLYELAYSLINETKLPIYGFLSAIIYNLPGILISGRDALIIFVISTIIIIVYCGNYAIKEMNSTGRKYKKIKRYTMYSVVIILMYLVLLSNNRYGTNESSALNMFKWSAGCEFPEYLENIYYNFGGIGKVIINVVFYYSSQLSKFSLIFNEYRGPYMFGLYELHYISRLFPNSWAMSYSLVTQQLTIITVNSGLPGIRIFWETAIGYLIYDFGKIGTLIMSFLFGILIKKISVWSKYNRNILKIIAQAFVCVAMFLTIEVSPVFDYFFIFPTIWLIIIILIYNKKISN